MSPSPCADVLIDPVATGTDPNPFPFLSEVPISQSPGHENPQVEYKVLFEHCASEVAPC